MARAQRTNGRVSFIGAGPGDPELLTVRAHRAVAAADLIVIDPDVPSAVTDLGGHAEVQAAIRDAIRRIAASGKAPGIIWTDPTLIRTALDDGARFVATAVDVITYADAIRAAAAAGKTMKG